MSAMACQAYKADHSVTPKLTILTVVSDTGLSGKLSSSKKSSNRPGYNTDGVNAVLGISSGNSFESFDSFVLASKWAKEFLAD